MAVGLVIQHYLLLLSKLNGGGCYRDLDFGYPYKLKVFFFFLIDPTMTRLFLCLYMRSTLVGQETRSMNRTYKTLVGQETSMNRTYKAFVYCIFLVDRCEYVNSKWCSIVITPKIKSLRYFNKIKLCTSFVSSVVFNGLKICWMMKAQKL